MSLKNQKIFTTSHKDFMLILKIYFFIIIEYLSRHKGLKITLMRFYFILLRSNNMFNHLYLVASYALFVFWLGKWDH